MNALPLEQIFSWLLKASWQASIIIALVLLVQWIFQKQLTARWRYLLWTLVVVRLLLPYLPPAPFSLHRFTTPPVVTRAVDVDPDRLTDSLSFVAMQDIHHSVAVTQDDTTLRHQVRLFPIFALLWAAGVLVMGGYILLMNALFLRRLRPIAFANGENIALLQTCAAEMKVRRRVRLIETPMVDSPAIMGIFRSALLMPEGFSRTFSREELRFIFLHELAHLKRGDVLVNWLLALLQCLHWFNPLVWYAFSRIRADREAATDAYVLERQGEGERSAYGSMLLTLVQSFNQPQRLHGMVGIMEGKTALRQRIQRIAGFTKGSYGWSFLGFACLCVLALICLTGIQAQPDSVATSASPASMPSPDEDGKVLSTTEYLRMKSISPEEVARLEESLKANPGDASLRGKLLAYYSNQYLPAVIQYGKDATPANKERMDHFAKEGLKQILWIIENAPEYATQDFANCSTTICDSRTNPPAFAAFRKAWLAQLEKHKGNPKVLFNAATGFMNVDLPLAKELFQQGVALEPQNPQWNQQLSQVYGLEAVSSGFKAQAGQKDAKRNQLKNYQDALAFAEQAYAQKNNPVSSLPDLATYAFEAGDYVKAKTYADKMLSEAPKVPNKWYYGNIVYAGHEVLGRLALMKGNVEEAKRQLLASADTPGSPQLNSFGPSLWLVSELLAIDQREVVIEFFGKVARFWKSAQGRIPIWQDKLRRGEKLKISAGMMEFSVEEEEAARKASVPQDSPSPSMPKNPEETSFTNEGKFFANSDLPTTTAKIVNTIKTSAGNAKASGEFQVDIFGGGR